MKIWEILKAENLGKKYGVKLYGIEQEVTVGYDGNSDYLTVKKETYPFYPLNSFYLGAILALEFEEAKYRKLEFQHSGMSYGLVCAMLKEFVDNGEEFLEFIRR